MGEAGRALSPWFVEAVLACARTQAQKHPCELADDARRVSMRPAQAIWQPRAVGSLEGATQARPAQQNHSLFNQRQLHSPQSFALHASQEPHRAVLADLAAAVLDEAALLCTSSSSVGSASCALACSSALRLSCFAGDTPLCLESTVCQNSSNSRSVISWLRSRLRDSIVASAVESGRDAEPFRGRPVREKRPLRNDDPGAAVISARDRRPHRRHLDCRG